MNDKQQQAADPLLLNIPRSAELLGVSQRWLWDRVHEGSLASVRMGRRVLIQRAALERFVDEHVVGRDA